MLVPKNDSRIVVNLVNKKKVKDERKYGHSMAQSNRPQTHTYLLDTTAALLNHLFFLALNKIFGTSRSTQ